MATYLLQLLQSTAAFDVGAHSETGFSWCFPADKVEPELLHTYSRIDPYDTLILCVRVAVLTAVTLTVPIVLFPVRENFFVFIVKIKSPWSVSNMNLISAGAQSHPPHVIPHQTF